VPEGVVKIVDFKPPASGEEAKNLWSNVGYLVPGQDEVKFVISDRVDYEWSVDRVREYGLDEEHVVLFSPVFGVLHPLDLTEWVLETDLRVRVQLQLHKYIWGPDVKGV
jgi:7-carboxy-7-deazaguanine synthase